MTNDREPSCGYVLLSAAVPGMGQLFSRRKQTGTVLFLLFLMVFACFYVEKIADRYTGWLALFAALFLLTVVSTVLCFAMDHRPIVRRWWHILLAIAIAWIASCLWFFAMTVLSHHRMYSISSGSMSPTVYAGDKIIVDERYYRHHPLQDGDIIAFHHKDFMIIKRISALPGETIEGKAGTLIRNDEELAEPYAAYSPDSPIDQIETFPKRTIGGQQIFLTGDARDASLDSRSGEFGEVHFTDVVGKVVFVYDSKHNQTGRSFP